MIKFLKNMVFKFRNSKRCMQEGDIEYEELVNKQKQGAILIDVRSKQEYNENNLKGSINIPEYWIMKQIKNVVQDKEKNIILYCSNGGRSRRAYDKLKKMGFVNVYNLYGGIDSI